MSKKDISEKRKKENVIQCFKNIINMLEDPKLDTRMDSFEIQIDNNLEQVLHENEDRWQYMSRGPKQMIGKFSILFRNKEDPDCCAGCIESPKEVCDSNDQWHIYCNNSKCVYYKIGVSGYNGRDYAVIAFNRLQNILRETKEMRDRHNRLKEELCDASINKEDGDEWNDEWNDGWDGE